MREQLPVPVPVVNETSDQRWAAWQARGAANDRATRRNLFVLAAILVAAAAVLSGLW